MLLHLNTNILVKKHIYIKNIHPSKTLIRCTKIDNNTAFVRTNVIGDFIEKYTTDVNMLHTIENEEYSCENIALLNSILIIGLIIYMFFDNSKKNDND